MTNWNKKYASEGDLTKLQNIIHEIRGHHEVLNEIIGALHQRLEGQGDRPELLEALGNIRNKSEDNTVEIAHHLDEINEYLKNNVEQEKS